MNREITRDGKKRAENLRGRKSGKRGKKGKGGEGGGREKKGEGLT